MADKNLVKHIINKNNMFYWIYNNVTHYSNSTVFWKSYLIFFFGYLWKKTNKNKAVLRDYVVLVLLCHACVIWIQIIMISSFYLKLFYFSVIFLHAIRTFLERRTWRTLFASLTHAQKHFYWPDLQGWCN